MKLNYKLKTSCSYNELECQQTFHSMEKIQGTLMAQWAQPRTFCRDDQQQQHKSFWGREDEFTQVV
jgi:hypothetical protein